jgi:hypothetical protein
MDANDTESLLLWIIEEQLRLSRHNENTQQALRLVLASVGGSIPPETLLQLDSLLAAHRHEDLIRALSGAAKRIREKSESAVPPLPQALE